MNDLWKRRAKYTLALGIALLFVLVWNHRVDDGSHRTSREGEVNLDEYPARETTQRGAILVELHCASCHGADLCGRKSEADEGIWLGPNVSSAGRCSSYTEEEFCRALREFRKPDGAAFSGPMPAVVTRDLSDDDLRAIWTFSRAEK